MPWYYLIYDGYSGSPRVGGYSNSFDEISAVATRAAEAGTEVSDVFEAADGYHSQFIKRKAIITVGSDGEVIETDL